MFSYNGEGLPLNIPPSSIEKMARDASTGHYMTSYSLGNNTVSYQHFHSQRPHFPYVAREVSKDSSHNVPGVSKDISSQLYPGIFYSNHNETIVKNHLEPIQNRFELATMERTREFLNIPQVKLNSQMNSYQNYIDQKSNILPAVEKKPSIEFLNETNVNVLKNESTLELKQEIDLSPVHKHHSSLELSLKQQTLDGPLEDGQDVDCPQKTHLSESIENSVDKSPVPKDVCAKVNTKVLSNSKIETGFFNSFARDPHGVIKDHIDLTLYQIIESIAEMKKTDTGSSKQVLYCCLLCNLHFTHPKRYKLHTKWHTFGRTNEQRRLLSEEKERRKKSKKKPLPEDEGGDFMCDVCGAGLASARKLQGHKMRVHKDLPKVCRLCNTTYQTNEQYQDHMKSSHTDADGNPQRYSCDYCDKTFCTYHSMIRHQGGHLEKKYPCNECEKRFGSIQKLKLHLKSHTRALVGKTLHCSYCGKGFYDGYSLQAHERVHRGDLVFKCDACGSGYATNASLKRHVKVSHGGAKPFECSICRRCFASQKVLQRHALNKHAPGGPKRRRKKKAVRDE